MTVVTEAADNTQEDEESGKLGYRANFPISHSSHLSYDVLRVSCVQTGGVRERVKAGCVTLILITASVTESENRHGKNSVYVGALILTISHNSSVLYFWLGVLTLTPTLALSRHLTSAFFQGLKNRKQTGSYLSHVIICQIKTLQTKGQKRIKTSDGSLAFLEDFHYEIGFAFKILIHLLISMRIQTKYCAYYLQNNPHGSVCRFGLNLMHSTLKPHNLFQMQHPSISQT